MPTKLRSWVPIAVGIIGLATAIIQSLPQERETCIPIKEVESILQIWQNSYASK